MHGDEYRDFALVVRVTCGCCGKTGDGTVKFVCPGTETPNLPTGWDWHREMYEDQRPRCEKCGEKDRMELASYHKQEEERRLKAAEKRRAKTNKK